MGERGGSACRRRQPGDRLFRNRPAQRYADNALSPRPRTPAVRILFSNWTTTVNNVDVLVFVSVCISRVPSRSTSLRRTASRRPGERCPGDRELQPVYYLTVTATPPPSANITVHVLDANDNDAAERDHGTRPPCRGMPPRGRAVVPQNAAPGQDRRAAERHPGTRP